MSITQPPPWPDVLPTFTESLGGRDFRFHDYRGLTKRQRGDIKVLLAEAWELLAPEIMCRSEGNEEQEERIVSNLPTSGAAQAVQEYRSRLNDRLSEQEFVGDGTRPLVFGVTENGEPVGAFTFYAINVRLVQGQNVFVSMMPFPAFHRAPNATLRQQMVMTANLCERALGFATTIRGMTVRVGEIRTLTYVNAARASRGDIECFLWNQEIDSRDGVSVEVITTQVAAWGLELRRIRSL